MPRVIHFEIGTEDPERAAQFYATVFGWKIVKWGGPVDYWLITTGPEAEPGIDGAIMQRAAPNMATVNTIGVESVSKYQDLVIAYGGKVIMPREVVPGVGYFAYCQDTEGNTFGIMEHNPDAT